jgi:hypothetical protein
VGAIAVGFVAAGWAPAIPAPAAKVKQTDMQKSVLNFIV